MGFLSGFLVFSLLAFASFIVSVWGFAQIIGSLQNIKTRGPVLTAGTITVWISILFLGWFLVDTFLRGYITVYYIATAIGFISILFSGKIE